MVRRMAGGQERILAVFDDPDAGHAGAAALHAAGFPNGAADVLIGPDAARRIDAAGTARGLAGRLRRALEFSLVDQMPALAWYEAALRDGRAVVVVRARTRDETMQAVSVLRDAGAHFVNRFGRFSTEEFARWRGPEPRIGSLWKH